ncbi:MAG: Nif3-like dinuclear metal center hexameric protein [Coriobacteriales bacterium]|nr:Nif3-like dinuclear metal center hexameric protein [Coriobacteriales bacterium]
MTSSHSQGEPAPAASADSAAPPAPAGSAAALSVRELEQLLFAAFPASDALEGDRVGLLVGDPGAEAGTIAVALDATVGAIEAAAANGCNVLVTHHPAYWNLPSLILREGSPACSGGDAVFRAAEKGVALISMHTNLDCAPRAAGMLLDSVGYAYHAPLVPCGALTAQLEPKPAEPADVDAAVSQQGAATQAALGQLGVPRARAGEAARPASLGELVARYHASFGAVAKVWGSPTATIRLLAACSGGGGELVGRVVDSGADCYVTGEVRYHEALELAAHGVALIELGHDRSELPYRFYLQECLLAAGVPHDRIKVIEPLVTWWQPSFAPQPASPACMV